MEGGDLSKGSPGKAPGKDQLVREGVVQQRRAGWRLVQSVQHWSRGAVGHNRPPSGVQAGEQQLEVWACGVNSGTSTTKGAGHAKGTLNAGLSRPRRLHRVCGGSPEVAGHVELWVPQSVARTKLQGCIRTRCLCGLSREPRELFSSSNVPPSPSAQKA